MIEQAKALIAKSFSGERTEGWTEGTIDAALKLCEKNGGLYLYPAENPYSLLAFFRYSPKQHEAVEEMDYCTLEEARLDSGPILHVVAMIEPRNGFQVLRQVIQTLNVYGMTAHRWNKREKDWRFVVLKNVRFDVERMSRRNNGKFRQWRQE
jgi:hypothetical protein